MTEKGTFVIDFRSVERKTMTAITLAIAILLLPAPSSAKDPEQSRRIRVCHRWRHC